MTALRVLQTLTPVRLVLVLAMMVIVSTMPKLDANMELLRASTQTMANVMPVLTPTINSGPF